MPSTERRSIDANLFSPADLAGLNDEQFRAVVDADLRSQASGSGARLRHDVAAALRTREHVARWHSMLSRMQKSVDGQLAARQCDFKADMARLGAKICSTNTENERENLRSQQHELRAKHEKARAGTLRFKTGLDEATLSAKFVRDQIVADEFGSTVVAERDHLAARCRRYAAAIESHRQAVTTDLGGDTADEIDKNLWSILRSPTEPTPHPRGSNDETHAGRDPGSRRTDDRAERFQLVGSAEA